MTEITAIPSGDVRDVVSVVDTDDVIVSQDGTTAKAPMTALRSYMGDGILAPAAAAAAAAAAASKAGQFYAKLPNDSGVASYSLPWTPIDLGVMTITRGRETLVPGTDYTLSENVITFTPALASGAEVVVKANAALGSGDIVDEAILALGFYHAATGDGTTTTYDLGFTPPNLSNISVVYGGVEQLRNVDYTLSGDILTFTSPWPVGESIVIRGRLPDMGGTVPASTVTLDDGESVKDRLTKQKRFMSEFGAVGDAVVANGLLASGTDDTAALQAAFDWAGARRGRKIVGDPGATYRLTSTITGAAPVNVDWNGAKIHVTANEGAFHFSAPLTGIYPLTTSYVIGSTNLAATTGTALRPGTWVKVITNGVDPGDRDEGSNANQYRLAEWARVGLGSTSTNIVLTRPLRFTECISPTSTVGDEARVQSYTTGLNARVIVPDMKTFQWVGGGLSYEDGNEATWNAEGLVVQGYRDGLITGFEQTRGYSASINVQGCINFTAVKCSARRLQNDTSKGQFGYGLAIGGSHTPTAIDCYWEDCRTGITSTRPPIPADSTSVTNLYRAGRTVGGQFTNCKGINFTSPTGSVFNTHQDAEDWVFTSCIAENCAGVGFRARGRNISFINPVGIRCNGGIAAITDFSSTPPDSDFWTAGKTASDFTSMRVVNPDMSCIGPDPVIYTNAVTADIVLGGTIRANHHNLMSLKGPTRVSGYAQFEVTDFDGSAPIIDVGASPVIEVFSVGSEAAGALSTVLTFGVNTDLRLDVRNTVTSGMTGLATNGSNPIELRGRLNFILPAATGTLINGSVTVTESGLIRYTVTGAADNSITIGSNGKQIRVVSGDATVNIGGLKYAPYSTISAAEAAIIPSDQREIEVFHDDFSIRRYRRTTGTGVFTSADGQLWNAVFVPGPYANDAAAQAAGIAIGEIYRVTGGTLAWRVS